MYQYIDTILISIVGKIKFQSRTANSFIKPQIIWWVLVFLKLFMLKGFEDLYQQQLPVHIHVIL